MSDSPQYADVQLVRRVLRDARRFWRHITAQFLVETLATPLALLTPLPLKLVIDNVLGGEPVPDFMRPFAPTGGTSLGFLVVCGLMLVFVVSATRLQGLASSLLQTYISEQMTLDFRARLFRHLQRLSFAYHDVSGTADAVYRVHYDAPAVTRIAVTGVTTIISAALTLVAMIYVTSLIAFELAAIALTIVPALAFLARYSRRNLRHRWRRVKRLEKSSMSVVEEVLANLRVVKGFAQEEREQARYVDAAGATLSARLRVTAAEGLIGFLTSLVTAVGTALVLVYGALQVQSGRLSLGDLVLVMGYMAQLYAPLKTLTDTVTSMQSAMASAERAYDVLDELPDVPERRQSRPIRRAVGDLRLVDVTFGYVPDRPVIDGLTLTIPPGSRVGIQGQTGSGKSTLASLLMRFYDPHDGRILLDGVDLRDYRIADLREQFGIVLQDPVLFSRTIRENIAYARPDATDTAIRQAALAAHAHEFILQLPAGYETLVGERGMTLSGGERQRISIARAFLKNAPILILDEPTSAVDLRTEALIMDALDRLMAGRTSFIIAHRLNTIAGCDIWLDLTPSHGFRRQIRRMVQREQPLPAAVAEMGRASFFSTAPLRR